MSKKELSSKQHGALLNTLKARFEKNMNRHKGLDWPTIQAKLEANMGNLWSLNEMEMTGGEPDVVGFDKKSGDYIFYDCSAESPKGRRSICYDHEALESRKEHKPENSATEMAADMGIELLTEEQYRALQQLGNFDTKTSSWVKTPADIRKLGGALFCDRRYNTVFLYHNGAESYYAARGVPWLSKGLTNKQNMSKRIMNPKVDFYFNKASWQKELAPLRMNVLDCGLTEELKWGIPCYMFQKSNIVLIHVFKEYCALLFFKGALLKDAKGILIQQTDNVQAARQIRFTNVREIVKMEPIIKAYIHEAIELEKAGLKVNLKKTTEFSMPEEFQDKLNKNAALQTSFDALTPGRQRGYMLYFSAPKQSKTRQARVEKSMKQILKGKGLNDL